MQQKKITPQHYSYSKRTWERLRVLKGTKLQQKTRDFVIIRDIIIHYNTYY